MKVFRRIAAACAVAVVLPQVAMATLLSPTLYVEIDYSYDFGVLPVFSQTLTTNPTVDASSGYTFQDEPVSDGDETNNSINLLFFAGEFLTIGNDAGGDFLEYSFNSDPNWISASILLSGWAPDTLLSVTPEGSSAFLTSTIGTNGENWVGTFDFSTNNTGKFYFGFQDDTGGPTGEVPLPMSAALLLTGIGGFAATRRRRG